MPEIQSQGSPPPEINIYLDGPQDPADLRDISDLHIILGVFF